MNVWGFEVPTSVVMVTGEPARPGVCGGAVVVQLVELWQETNAAVAPKWTEITPFLLKKLEPVRVIFCPALPELGERDARFGAPPGRAVVGGGAIVPTVGGAGAVPAPGVVPPPGVVAGEVAGVVSGGGTATVDTATVGWVVSGVLSRIWMLRL